jgi:hypothetical protein
MNYIIYGAIPESLISLERKNNIDKVYKNTRNNSINTRVKNHPKKQKSSFAILGVPN